MKSVGAFAARLDMTPEGVERRHCEVSELCAFCDTLSAARR